MKTTRVTAMTLLGAIASAGVLEAHHSGSMFEPTPTWVEGIVIAYEPSGPHSITTIQTIDSDGHAVRWAIEGPSEPQRGQRGISYVPELGDDFRACAFTYKEEWSDVARRQSPDADGVPIEFAMGHVLELPDGQKQPWGAQGVFSECVRTSSDSTEAWVAYVDGNRRVRQAWCSHRAFRLPLADDELEAFIEDFNGRIADPC